MSGTKRIAEGSSGGWQVFGAVVKGVMGDGQGTPGQPGEQQQVNATHSTPLHSPIWTANTVKHSVHL